MIRPSLELEVVPETVPAGYELAGLAAQRHHPRPGLPVHAEFVIRAQRSLQVTVTGATGEVEIEVPALDRRLHTDAQGRVVLRGLPPGTLTLILRRDGRERRHVVHLPDGPGRVSEERIAAP